MNIIIKLLAASCEVSSVEFSNSNEASFGELDPKRLKKPIVFIKFLHNQRPQNSYFRYGLDHIREAIFKLSDKVQPLKECIKWLTLP